MVRFKLYKSMMQLYRHGKESLHKSSKIFIRKVFKNLHKFDFQLGMHFLPDG